MKKLFLIISILLVANSSFAAGSSSSGDSNKTDLYKSGKKLVYRAKKLEKKDKFEKALKLYSKASDKLLKAYEKDKKNPDILNYLGYSLRKTGEERANSRTYSADSTVLAVEV